MCLVEAELLAHHGAQVGRWRLQQRLRNAEQGCFPFAARAAGRMSNGLGSAQFTVYYSGCRVRDVMQCFLEAVVGTGCKLEDRLYACGLQSFFHWQSVAL